MAKLYETSFGFSHTKRPAGVLLPSTTAFFYWESEIFYFISMNSPLYQFVRVFFSDDHRRSYRQFLNQ
jgi:hypothetical protein